jgi:hypothetical protein
MRNSRHHRDASAMWRRGEPHPAERPPVEATAVTSRLVGSNLARLHRNLVSRTCPARRKFGTRRHRSGTCGFQRRDHLAVRVSQSSTQSADTVRDFMCGRSFSEEAETGNVSVRSKRYVHAFADHFGVQPNKYCAWHCGHSCREQPNVTSNTSNSHELSKRRSGKFVSLVPTSRHRNWNESAAGRHFSGLAWYVQVD